MTIEDFHGLPANVQDMYLSWSKRQFEKERAAFLYEKAGGVTGLARMNALQELSSLEDSFGPSWIPAYRCNTRRSDRLMSSVNSMVSLSPDVQQY